MREDTPWKTFFTNFIEGNGEHAVTITHLVYNSKYIYKVVDMI